MYDFVVKRVQIHLEEDLDRAATAEAARRGMSKAALIRVSLAKELEMGTPADADGGWAALTGWLEDGGVGHVDDVVYGPVRGDQER